MPAPPWTQKIGGCDPCGWIGTSDVQRGGRRRRSRSGVRASRSSARGRRRRAAGCRRARARSRANSCAATIEVTPRSKKLSVTPIGRMPSSRSQISTSRRSSAVRGATYSSSVCPLARRRRQRLAVDLAVRRQRKGSQRSRRRRGTMYAGSDCREVAPQRVRRHWRPRRDDVGDELARRRASSRARDRHAARNGVMAGERRSRSRRARCGSRGP